MHLFQFVVSVYGHVYAVWSPIKRLLYINYWVACKRLITPQSTFNNSFNGPSGTARMAPSYANLFMAEQRLLKRELSATNHFIPFLDTTDGRLYTTPFQSHMTNLLQKGGKSSRLEDIPTGSWLSGDAPDPKSSQHPFDMRLARTPLVVTYHPTLSSLAKKHLPHLLSPIPHRWHSDDPRAYLS